MNLMVVYISHPKNWIRAVLWQSFDGNMNVYIKNKLMDKNSEIVNYRHWSEGLGMLLVDF